MQNAAPLKFDPKPSKAAFSATSDNCRPEVASDVISSLAVELARTDVRVNFVDSGYIILEIHEPLTL